MNTNEQAPAPVAGDEPARPASEQPVEAIGAGREEMAWHRERGLIYSLMQKGWRKGQPVMVNDVMIRVETCNGSETDIEPILQTILAALSPASPARTPMGETDTLVDRFADALKSKLRAAGEKYGFDDAWKQDDWREKLVEDLWRHVQKGDPRDVAAYCAFAWHHGWSLAAPTPMGGEVEALREAAQRMADDYQVSSNHHPHHVLVQRKDFDDLCRALAAASPSPAQGGEAEALREALREIAALPKLSRDPADDYCRGVRAARHEARQIAECALAASSPYPAQGGAA